jgi:CspA family cold shock protein
METGTIKFVNLSKGYGFINPDAGGDALFFHVSAMDKDAFSRLQTGDSVSYEVGKGRDDRICAKRVILVEC